MKRNWSAISFVLSIVALLMLPLNAVAEDLADAIPGVKKFDALKGLVADHVDVVNDEVTVTGSLNDKQVKVSQSVKQNARSFSVEAVGEGLKMSDLIGEFADFPGNDSVLIERTIFNESTLTMTAEVQVQGREMAIEFHPRGFLAKIAARTPNVKLGVVLPELANVPIIDDLAFDSLMLRPTQKSIDVEGRINDARGTLALDIKDGVKTPSASLSATDGQIRFSDMVPDLAGVPIVDAFGFQSITYDGKTKLFDGRGKVGSVGADMTLDVGQGISNVIATATPDSPLQLKAILPRLKGVDLTRIPMVESIEFTSARFDKAAERIVLAGSVNHKNVSLAIGKSDKLNASMTAADPITLTDAIPELREVPGVGMFELKQLALDGNAVSAELALRGETARLVFDLGGGTSVFESLAISLGDSKGISLGQLIPELNGVPVIKDFGVAGLRYIERTGMLIADLVLNEGGKAIKAQLRAIPGTEGQPYIFKLTSTDLTIGKLIPATAGVPLVGDLGFTELDVTPASVEASIRVGDESVTVFADVKGGGFVALDFGAGLDLAKIVPSVAGSVLEGTRLGRSLFVLTQSTAVLPSSLPARFRSDFTAEQLQKPLKRGLNLLANIRPQDLGPALKGVLGKLGMGSGGSGGFPVAGTLKEDVFSFIRDGVSAAKPEIVSAILAAIDINVDVPVPQISALKSIATFDAMHLTISGNQDSDPFWDRLPAEMLKRKPTGPLDVSLRGGVTLNLGGFGSGKKTPIDLQTMLDLNVGGEAKTLSLLGAYAGVWENPFGIKELTFEKSGFDLSLEGGKDGEKVALDFFSEAMLHGKTGLTVKAAFSEEPDRLPHLDYFVLDGPLALTDLAGSLPNAENFIVQEIKLYPTGIETQVEAKNGLFDQRTRLFLFDIDTGAETAFVAAIDLAFNAETRGKQNFSLGRLAKIAGLKGANAAFIQSNLDAMAVANAALVLSTKKLYPLPPDSLKNGIAKDMFEGIFGDSAVPVKLDNVTFLSDFRADLMGKVGNALVNGVDGVKLGLSSEAIINGSVGGLFDSDPLSLDLEFLMAESLSLDDLQKSGLKLPSFLKVKPKTVGGAEKIGLFLKVVDTTFEAGLLAGFDMQYNDTSFDFTGTLGVQLAEEEVGLSLSGAMSDTWKNALGIKGFELENVTVSGEVEADPPSLKFGLGGEASLWGHDMSTSGDLMLGLAGEVPVPEGLGVKTTVSNLDVTMYEILNTLTLASNATLAIDPAMWPILIVGVVGEVGLSEGYTVIYDEVKGKQVTAKDLEAAPADDLLRLIKDYSELQAWLFGGKDIYLSFATPGASDTNLGIPDGIHFSGEVSLFGGAIKSPALRPDIGWIYRIARSLDRAKDAAKGAAIGAKRKASDAAGTGQALTADEFAALKNNITQLRSILAHELGMTRNAVQADYPKPSKKELQSFLDSLSFDQPRPFKLGGLEFSGSHISLVPFRVSAKTKLFGNDEDVEMSIKGGKLVLEAKTRIEILGDVDLLLEFDMAKQDFIVAGEYAQNPAIQKWLADEIQKGIKQIRKTADAKLQALNKVLANAKKARDDAENVLHAAQSATSEVTQAAVDRLQQETNNYQNDYNNANNQYNNCHGWKKEYCKAKWWPRKELAWGTLKASEQLLSDAKEALGKAKSLAIEVHSAEIAFNKAATDLALAAKDVEVIADVEAIMAKGLDTFANDAGKMAQLFKLDKAFVGGSLKDVAAGKPLVAELLFELNGKNYREFFALSPVNADFNALSFGLLPVIASEHIVDDMESRLERELGPTLGNVGNLSAKLTGWIKTHIYELIGGLRDDLEKQIADIQYELTQEESRYQKIFSSLDSHSVAYLDAYKDLTDESNQILTTYKMTDFMPASQVFSGGYLAVGHSSLCLAVAPNGIDVYQKNCKDNDTEQWDAVSLGKLQEGYIQLKSKGLCLKARDADGLSGQPMMLAKCNGKDDHERWKLISQDQEFSKFVNRFAQKCLHFDTENANEKAGYAVWNSCFGSDSQGFRVLKDGERPTFNAVEKLLKTRSGSCLGVSDTFAKYFAKTANGYSTTNRTQLVGMLQRRDNVLNVASCEGADDLFNYVEAVNGDLKLVHAASGWCVVPGASDNRALTLMPCDNDKSMYWSAHETGDDGFVFRNNQTGRCIDLGSTDRGTIRSGANSRVAVSAVCNGRPDQVLFFVKD